MKKLSPLRLGLATVGLLATLLASSCGGSGELVATFAPQRILVFGDENSVLTSTGNKYSINALNADSTINCFSNPLWIQVLGNQYGIGYPECSLVGDVATPRGKIFAAPETGVADIQAQIAAAAGTSGFTSTDLTTIYTGLKDIVAIYQTMSSGSDLDAARSAAEAAGAVLGQQVNFLADAGARVLIVTVPNVGLTPYALVEKATHTDFDRADALTQITNRFNARLRSTIYNDGRRIGLIQLDEYVGVVIGCPGCYGYIDAITPACTVALPNCTTATLVPTATSNNFLWANDRLVGATAQQQTGNLAVTRAINNPF